MKMICLSVASTLALLANLSGCGGDNAGLVETASAVPVRHAVATPQFHFRGSGPRFIGQGPDGGLSPAEVVSHYAITGDGSGQSIAIVDVGDDSTIESDLAAFDAQFGVTACTTTNACFQKIYAAGEKPADLGWSLEIALDVEWAHAIAPKAKIVLVEAASAYDNDLQAAISIATQRAPVVSMSWGMAEYRGETAFDQSFHVPHVIFVAAAGDTGNVRQYPAASPYVVAVGGTSLKAGVTGLITESAWSRTGGGPSLFESIPADQMTYGIFASAGRRAIPDVAYNADPQSGYSVYNSASGGWIVVGGTSAGAPQWAAIFALANQQRAAQGRSALDDSGAALYFAARQNASRIMPDGAGFIDIVSGTDGFCGINCQARVGFDDLTGLGVPGTSALIFSLAAYTP